MKIVSLGSALQDIYLIDHDDFVAEKSVSSEKATLGQIIVGSKVDIDKIRFDIGGGGTNAAVTFARYGHRSIYIGNLGIDWAGDSIIGALNDEDIDASYVDFIPHANTGVSVILLDSKTGERTILTYRGTSGKFDKLDASDLEMIQPDWLYVSSLRGNMEKLLEFFEMAHNIGCKIMFNPGEMELRQEKKLKGLLEDTDIILVNKSEAAKIVPGTVLEELLSHLRNYVPKAIITDGAMGGIACDGKKAYRFGIYEDVPVRDTTGAGDAFGSGFLAHFAAGHSFKSSLIYASANSTSVVQKLGSKAGILYNDTKLHSLPIQEIEI